MIIDAKLSKNQSPFARLILLTIFFILLYSFNYVFVFEYHNPSKKYNQSSSSAYPTPKTPTNWLMHYCSVSHPTYMPLYCLIQLALAQQILSVYLIQPPKNNVHIPTYMFLETSTYFAVEQSIFVQIIYSFYNSNTAWMLSLYFSIYFYQHALNFTHLYPTCTLSNAQIHAAMTFFIYVVELLSFHMHTPFYNTNKKTETLSYNEMARYHFEAWLLSDLISHIHAYIWKNVYKNIHLIISKQQSHTFS